MKTRRAQQPRFEIYREGRAPNHELRPEGGWRWRLVGRNGKILADSGEAYTRKADVKRALDTTRQAILEAGAPIDLSLDLKKRPR